MTRARAAGLPGTWRALLSTGAVHARNRIHYNWDRLKTMDGRTIATSSSDLWDGTIGNRIDRGEKGELISFHAWTGTEMRGFRTEHTCKDWTTSVESLPRGTFGLSSRIDHGWVNAGFGVCNSPLSLYCVEQ